MHIAVYGAAGHTGRFVVDELLRRGDRPIAVGRDGRKLLEAFGERVERRTASIDSGEALDRAFADADAVINCAGPFLDTAPPVIEAALRAEIDYIDVTAEQGGAMNTFASYAERARERGVTLVPAASFYGAFADLLVSYAMDDWEAADRIDVAIALDHWWPTSGTRITGQRNTAQRLVIANGELTPLDRPAPEPWAFPQPFGLQDVIELPFTEMILASRRIHVTEMHTYLNEAPLRDLRDPATPPPAAADERGRSTQRFLVETVVRYGEATRRAAASGRDIYAVTAPIAIEAAHRAHSADRAGAFALSELCDSADVLRTLADGHLDDIPRRS